MLLIDYFQIVEYFMIFMGLLFVLFEVYLNIKDIGSESSNIWLLNWSKKQFFFIPFALGAIIGHLFLGTKHLIIEDDIIPRLSNGFLTVIVIFIVALIMTVIGFTVQFKKSSLFLSVLLIVGILYGHFFWSMNIVK